jgi:hypothetical protein
VGVLLRVKGAAAWQMSVAMTDCPVARPALLPAPRINPLPFTVIRPFVFTLASSESMTQICPAGATVRTALVARGMTPIPPSKLASVLESSSDADAGNAQTAPRKIVLAKVLLSMATPLGLVSGT